MSGPATAPSRSPPTENVHLAFPVADDGAVAEFHRVATDAGYRDNGEPGERPQYHAGYVGAFVFDPDGNNVEAVNHNR
jgi:catechol 2,3-dioxygenase-like lactoylglutathione lyase family enzyme